MDNKEKIIEAVTALLRERGELMNEITVREISERAGVGLGLINYHFGSKDKLIEICAMRMLNGSVEKFRSMQEETAGLSPARRLEYLGNMTMTFLFDHYAISKVSMLTDMAEPKENDNTHRTYAAFLPLVAACRSDWDELTVKHKTFLLIASMQQAFLRHQEIFREQGINLTDTESRKSYHSRCLRDILEV